MKRLTTEQQKPIGPALMKTKATEKREGNKLRNTTLRCQHSIKLYDSRREGHKVLASFTLPAPMMSAKDEPLEQSPSVSTKEILPLRTQKHQWHGTIPCLAKVGEADDSKTSGDA